DWSSDVCSSDLSSAASNFPDLTASSQEVLELEDLAAAPVRHSPRRSAAGVPGGAVLLLRAGGADDPASGARGARAARRHRRGALAVHGHGAGGAAGQSAVRLAGQPAAATAVHLGDLRLLRLQPGGLLPAAGADARGGGRGQRAGVLRVV